MFEPDTCVAGCGAESGLAGGGGGYGARLQRSVPDSEQGDRGVVDKKKHGFFGQREHQARGYRLVPAASPPPPILPVSFPDALQKPASALQGS